MSLLRTDRACAYFAAIETRSNARVDVQILVAEGASPTAGARSASDEDAVDAVHLRFLADARKAAALEGPHNERIMHVGVTSDGHPFVVREPLDLLPMPRQTLAKLLEKMRSLPTESAVDVALAVCRALENAHAHGLVHGDLDTKQVHLVWFPEGPSDVKVAGLGTSRALAMLPPEGRALADILRRAPELLGPESDIDARADVWGVGVLLYTMLAGAPPFGADSPSMLDVTLAADEPAMLAGVPDGLAEIVDACLTKDPALRPLTAAALGSKLAPFGSQPIFAKRSSLLVVDTGPYTALVLEGLVKETRPAPSEPSVEVEVEIDVDADLELPLTKPVVVAPSVAPPPVSFSVVPPPVAAAAAPSSRSSRRAISVVAAACVVVALTAGALSVRRSSSPPAAAAEAPPRAEEQPLSVAIVQAAPAPVPVAVSVADLPAMATAPAAPARAHTPASKPRAVASAPLAPHAEPIAPAPAPAAAPAPIQPQPKASDDDLRRFLDDRR